MSSSSRVLASRSVRSEHNTVLRRISDRLALFLRPRPLGKFCLLFLAGVGIAVFPGGGEPEFWKGVMDTPFLPFIGSLVILLGVPPLKKFVIGERRWFVWTAVSILAGFAVGLHGLAVPPDDISQLSSRHLISVEGEVVSRPRVGEWYASFLVECHAAWIDTRPLIVTGRCEVRIPVHFHHGGLLKGGLVGARLPRNHEGLHLRGVLLPYVAGASPVADLRRHEEVFSYLTIGKGGVLRSRRGAPGTGQRVDRVVNWLLRGIAIVLPRNESAAVAGMLFHRQEEMDPGSLDDLQRTGTSHILATAGLHVGVFLALCSVLQKFLPRRTATLLSMLLVAGYCVACGAWPAVLRATLVAELCLLAWLVGRLPDPFTTLSLVAALMAARHPRQLLDAGFQFTFCTVGVILLLLPLVRIHAVDHKPTDPVGPIWRHAREVFGLSAVAQIGSWPLTAYYFGVISLIGVLANVPIVLLLMVIIPLALFTGILAHLSPILAHLPGTLLHGAVSLLLAVAHRMARLPFACFEVSPPAPLAIVLYYLTLCLFVAFADVLERPEALPSQPQKESSQCSGPDGSESPGKALEQSGGNTGDGATGGETVPLQ